MVPLVGQSILECDADRPLILCDKHLRHGRALVCHQHIAILGELGAPWIDRRPAHS